jgi:hypothetical protein
MKRWRILLLTLVGTPFLQADPAPLLLETLPQNSIQTAFQILRRDYIRRDDLSYEELNRAALQGLLERLSFGAKIVPKSTETKPVAPAVHAEFLAAGIGYLRPMTFQSSEGSLFEKALQEMAGKKLEQLVLDLRAPADGSFAMAAEVLQCLVPDGGVLFKLKQLGQEQAELFLSQKQAIWRGPMIVLIDGETGSAAETVAACLHQRGLALLCGEKTRGATVSYTEVQLDEKSVLSYASAEMLLADDSSVFRKGLSPEFVAKLPAKDKAKIFRESRNASLKPFVFDQVRPRFNESALVNGGNPELDAYVKKSLGEPLPGDEGQLRDSVIQRALDVLAARAFLTGSSMKWENSSSVHEKP